MYSKPTSLQASLTLQITRTPCLKLEEEKEIFSHKTLIWIASQFFHSWTLSPCWVKSWPFHPLWFYLIRNFRLKGPHLPEWKFLQSLIYVQQLWSSLKVYFKDLIPFISFSVEFCFFSFEYGLSYTLCTESPILSFPNGSRMLHYLTNNQNQWPKSSLRDLITLNFSSKCPILNCHWTILWFLEWWELARKANSHLHRCDSLALHKRQNFN